MTPHHEVRVDVVVVVVDVDGKAGSGTCTIWAVTS
jgi:hypothetical protein